jgi:hypothetical protein
MSVERRATGETVLTMTLLDPKAHKPIRFTKIGEQLDLPIVTAPPRDFTASKFSRSLHKIGLNSTCYRMGHSFVLQSECDAVRKFVRQPHTAHEFRAYGQYGGSERPASWRFTPYESKSRHGIRWILDMPLHGHAFAVCVNGDHGNALEVLRAHARTRPGLDILCSAKQAMAALPSRNPLTYVTAKPDDGKPDFLIEIAMMKLEITFKKDETSADSPGPPRS